MEQHDTIEREKIKVKRPKKWAIILHNDDTTPMDFVVELLYTAFGHDIGTSIDIMMKVHTDGSGVAGVYVYEVAEEKYSMATTIIRLSGYKLKLTLEEED